MNAFNAPWLLDAVAVLMILVGIPLWRRKVPPNRLYGFRTARTLANARAWYIANHLLGRNLIVAMLAFIALNTFVLPRFADMAHAATVRLLTFWASVLVAVALADCKSRKWLSR